MTICEKFRQQMMSANPLTETPQERTDCWKHMTACPACVQWVKDVVVPTIERAQQRDPIGFAITSLFLRPICKKLVADDDAALAPKNN